MYIESAKITIGKRLFVALMFSVFGAIAGHIALATAIYLLLFWVIELALAYNTRFTLFYTALVIFSLIVVGQAWIVAKLFAFFS